MSCLIIVKTYQNDQLERITEPYSAPTFANLLARSFTIYADSIGDYSSLFLCSCFKILRSSFNPIR